MSATTSTTATGTHLSEIASPLPDGMFGARERLDPYWDGLWVQGSLASWATRTDVEAMNTAGLVNAPAWMLADRDQAVARVREDDRLRDRRINMLSAVNAWRTLTAEQLVAMTGDLGLANWSERAYNKIVADSFNAHLVDLGRFIAPVGASAGSSNAQLIRTTRSEVFDKDIAPHLTYTEHVRVTGGSGWKSAGQYDRHNVLATELGLRVSELCGAEVGAVLGELNCPVSLLSSTSNGGPGEDMMGKTADLAVIRGDGARLAVEVTASVSGSFTTKVNRWAKALANSPWDLTGLMVVFVVAPPVARTSRQSVEREVRAAVSNAVKHFPGTARTGWTADRMAVVRWDEWFPARHHVRDEFFDLSAWRPTGPADERWQRVGLLDIFDVAFEPHPSHDPSLILAAKSYLPGVAHWLRRDPPGVHLWPLVVRASGTDQIPVPGSRNAGQAPATKFAQPPGAASTPRPPGRYGVKTSRA
ncbi:hypothetical protein [Oerskovia enterophila]|uniref:Uncharacterized protein n=1 Tax=Oerskovia enterophila TaxID=43678 RepID=A0ABX2YA50_9CELL|nr:hypothetical protein [Oerskovia enterophila]OCI32916.1 hypothetical protein OERS_05080 [Oerskovia enterophila]